MPVRARMLKEPLSTSPRRKLARTLPVPVTPGNAVSLRLNVKLPVCGESARLFCSLRTSAPNLTMCLPLVQDRLGLYR